CSPISSFSWDVYKQGLPHCMKAKDVYSLPWEVRFSITKEMQFYLTAAEGMINYYPPIITKCVAFSEYVQKHWREDAFFGYQFLNGVNPMMIQRCSKLPSNFPVTENMLYLHGARSLEEEMQKGNIFLCDYKTLDGVKANVIHDEQQYLVAPLVLLHQTPDGKLLKPIAIQQTPGEDNPIFLPSDSEYDWLLAKTFVRSAYFNEHELNIHLLCTHLLAEVFTVALLRNVPMVHPLYKVENYAAKYT
uniref:Lipoxygenase domain-containing protein n=1 Tax=Neogobius melanostomus TaxID=47308 RepID=A0A8C6SIF3_9GOBI